MVYGTLFASKSCTSLKANLIQRASAATLRAIVIANFSFVSKRASIRLPG